ARSRRNSKHKHWYRGVSQDHESRRRRQATANRTLAVLRAALNRCLHRWSEPLDPNCLRIKQFDNVDSAHIHYLTENEARRLINCCDCGFDSLVEAVIQTGAGYNELPSLRFADFNPQ